MAEGMIEKVARAICAARGRDPDDVEIAIHSYPSQGSASTILPRPAWREYEYAARAAVEAMREPTAAIVEAAEDIVVGYDDFALGDGNIYLGIPGYPQKTTEVWGKLIDAALAEEPV